MILKPILTILARGYLSRKASIAPRSPSHPPVVAPHKERRSMRRRDHNRCEMCRGDGWFLAARTSRKRSTRNITQQEDYELRADRLSAYLHVLLILFNQSLALSHSRTCHPFRRGPSLASLASLAGGVDPLHRPRSTNLSRSHLTQRLTAPYLSRPITDNLGKLQRK